MLDVAIIGSGYGGAVTAARLAGLGRVLLIERGRRWNTGEFPTTLPGLIGAFRSRRNPLGLWSIRLGRGTGNAFASGLGGGSLVNYGITSQPDDHVFEEWPLSAIEMAPYYERAREILRPSTNPVGIDLADHRFLDLVEPGRRVDLENAIDWEKCTQCGHCVPGCNHGAKRSLDRTYLPIALENGLEIRIETKVVSIRRRLEGDGYDLVVAPSVGGPTETIAARRVVVAAGAFGTLDLLHRLRDRFPLSPLFGQRLGMNGDAVAFLYGTDHPQSGAHGAPISTTVRYRFDDERARRRTLTVMAGRIPRSMARFSAAILAIAGGLASRTGPPSRIGLGRRLGRSMVDLIRVEEGGALDHTFMFKLDGQDSARGTAHFDRHGHAAIDWPDSIATLARRA